MTNNLLISFIIAFIYLISKFLEMRYIVKENRPLKDLILDSGLVFISSLFSFFIFEQFSIDNMLSNVNNLSPDVFTGNADF